MSSDAEAAALSRMRQLLSEADALASAGSLAAAEAKCQEAGGLLIHLGQLCQARPQLKAEAEPLLRRLKASVAALKKKRSGGPSRNKDRTAADVDDEERRASEAALLGDDNPFSERNVLQAYEAQQRQQLQLARSRETAMERLAKDMSDLDGIFCQLSELVKEQGEQIQLIEDHVNDVEVKVTDGAEQLADAVVKQRSSRKKKIIIICVVVAAVLLLALILYLVLSKVL